MIYRYVGAADRLSGSQDAVDVMPLASGNGKPEGIADPTEPINIGDVIARDLSVAGEVDTFTFNGTAVRC